MTAGLKKITELSAVLNLHQQDFLKKSKEMLYRIEEEKVLKGRSIDSKVAMIIFLIARNLKRPKNVEDITKYLRTTKQEVNNCYKVLKKSNIFPWLETRLQPSDIVNQSASKLNLSHEVKQLAMKTADNFRDVGICEGKRPPTIAGASILIIASLKKIDIDIDDIAR